MSRFLFEITDAFKILRRGTVIVGVQKNVNRAVFKGDVLEVGTTQEVPLRFEVLAAMASQVSSHTAEGTVETSILLASDVSPKNLIGKEARLVFGSNSKS